MTAAVLTHKGITNPFLYINNRERTTTNAVSTASARSTTHNTSMTNGAMSPAESSTGAFGRMRSTIEQSLRNATRSKKSPSPDADEFATITARPSKGKGKEREVPVPVPKLKESSKSNNLLSKVTFGRAGRESLSPSPIPPAPVKKDASDVVRQAGFTSYMTPSLRGGSMSSPSLPLSSQQPTNTHKSRPPIPAPSSSAADGLARAPSRDRQGRSSMQPSQREISTPVPLGTRRETPAHQSKSSSSSKPTTRHRSTQSVPLVLSHQLPSSPVGKVETARSPEPSRSRRKDAELPSPPSSPTPPSPTRSNTFYASRRVAASSGHLPLNNSPLAPRATSPGRTRPSRVITPTQREIRSPTPSNLPSPPSTPTSARRPSIESPHRSALEKARRPSMDAPRPSIESTRRPSVGSPRRPSIEAPRRPSIEVARQESPSPRPRPVSPNQRSYAQNRHFNMSTASLTGPPNPEYRELIRTATSMLCKELIKKPMHLSKNEAGAKDWAEVEERMNALRRAERMWSKSAVAPASPTSSGFNSAEERERRLFWETLRDGFVLCHLLNKMRSGFVVKPDPREERVTRLSNVNKFLAACASHGLPDSDTFNPDDLTEGTGECLARVAKTIIALVRHVETPMNEKPTFITATEEAKRPAPIAIPPRRHRIDSPPRGSPGLAPRTSLSVSPGRRRYSPPSGLPPVYAHEDVFIEDSGDETEGPFSSPSVILTPPPKSPLRARAARRNSENKYPLGSSPSPMSTSVPNSSSLHESFAMRQSVASSALTESTATTDISSILDFGRSRTYSNGHSKFGTIRTMTTDVTSEAPSMSRTEGSAIADELARKWYPLPETPTKHRDIKLSDAAEVMRVVEEGDESVCSSRSGGKNRERAAADRDQPTPSRPDKHNAIHLRKGKWPDDFMDVFRGQSPPSNLDPDLLAYLDDQESTSSVISTSSAISASPPSRSPRKLAIVEGNQRNDGKDPLPRRPTHRARQTADAPILLPKEALQFRDSSPDPSMASSGRVLLRRHSTKPNVASRSAVALPPQLDDTDELSGQTHVPFPRTTSGEYLNAEIGHHERPRLHRGRFQSDIDSSSARRRTRPTSIDGLRPDRRSRIESMGHLGSKNESASDLLASPRDSVDGSAVRKTLVVREDGKAPVHFQLGNCIGRGQFGTVYRALNLNTGQTVAVKRIRLEGLKEDEVTQLMQEVDLMKSLSHPSIVKYEGMERDQDTLSIVLEYAENGSLGQTLKAFGKLNERLVANYVVKILEGLHYLHENDVVHCDLKAANILTTKTGNVKLSDFGVSLNLRAVERDQKDVAGTPNWMAPEVIELKGASPKSDIWSLGCTVVELLTGRPPYAEITNSMSVMFRIVEDTMPPLPEDCSPLLEDFLRQCFYKDPTKRPSAELLFEHAWLKKNWGLHQELRPQDSIPFLRRVSADLNKQRSDVMKLLSQGETPPSPSQPSPQSPPGRSPLGKRTSDLSMNVLGSDNDLSVREHQFVKTTFSKPMVCRVCLLNVKKSAVLCAQCSLIAHSKCTPDAPPTCDFRAQLLHYAKFAEAGSPTSQYSNPADGLPKLPVAPASDVPYISHSPRTSIDGAASPPPLPANGNSLHPPVAYKFMGAFKRSRSNLTTDTMTKGASSQEKLETTSNKRRSGTSKAGRHERPRSTTSNTTDPNSVRSAVTGGGSGSSRYERSAPSTSGKSAGSPLAEPTPTSSKLTTQSAADTIDTVDTTEYGEIDYNEAIPGSLPTDTRRHRKKDSNCAIQ